MLRVPTLLSFLIFAVGLASTAAGQQSQGDFVVTAAARSGNAGGLWLITPLAGDIKNLNATGALVDSYSLATDPYDDEVVWVGTIARGANAVPAIYRVITVGGRILTVTKHPLGLTAADKGVWQLQVLGTELLFLTSTQLSSVPLTGGRPRVLLRNNGSLGVATDFASDGRSLFLHMQPTLALTVDHVYRLDLELPSFPTLIYQSAAVTYLINSISMAADGKLLLLESEVFSQACVLRHLDASGTQLRSIALPFPYGGVGAQMDPAGSAVVVVAGKRFDRVRRRVTTGFITLLNWAVFKSEFGTGPEAFRNLGVRRHWPLHRNGHACWSPSGPGYRAEISANSLPWPGNATYKLRLEGPLYAPTLLLVGLHGAVKAPIKLDFMGAGTCELGVQALFVLGGRLSGTGILVQAAPIPGGAAKGNIDIQWLIADSSANAAGFVTSQVGSVVVR